MAERLPVEDAWADMGISNGVINLCADKREVFCCGSPTSANRNPVPPAALNNVNLWTA